MDVLKQRLQTGRETTKSAPVLIKRIWNEEGYRGVWRGYFFSLAQFGPYGMSCSLYRNVLPSSLVYHLQYVYTGLPMKP
jgi:hypothetical protein